MKSRQLAFAAAAVFATAILMAAGALAQNQAPAAGAAAPPSDFPRVAASLDQTGHIYSKLDNGVWAIDVGVEDKKIRFIVRAMGDVVVVFVLLGNTPDKISDDLKNKLIDLNNNYYIAKFSFDDDNVYLRIDSLIYNLDGAVLNNFINRILQITQKEMPELAKLLPPPAKPAPAPQK